jgi:hypothetical protein
VVLAVIPEQVAMAVPVVLVPLFVRQQAAMAQTIQEMTGLRVLVPAV